MESATSDRDKPVVSTSRALNAIRFISYIAQQTASYIVG